MFEHELKHWKDTLTEIDANNRFLFADLAPTYLIRSLNDHYIKKVPYPKRDNDTYPNKLVYRMKFDVNMMTHLRAFN